MIRICSPVKGYNGVSAGIGFAMGQAITNELTESQKRYFIKKGYTIEEMAEMKTANTSGVPGSNETVDTSYFADSITVDPTSIE